MINSDGHAIREGDWITLSSRHGAIYEGEAKFKPGRLLRYMKGEPLDLDEDERKSFASIAYAFRYYQQLNRGIEFDQTSTLSEVLRLVNFELRGETEQARQLVNGWFDNHEALYMEEVLKSDIGDHLGQSNVFEMLTLERKIRFFKRALAKCFRDRISGYEAGAFMLGRFLSLRYPIAFWRALTPAEIGLLVNEWVLFEKYMQVLHNVGERKVLLARKQILMNGLEEIAAARGATAVVSDYAEAERHAAAGGDTTPCPNGAIRSRCMCWNFSSSPTGSSTISRRAGPFASWKKSAKRRTSRLPRPDDR